MSRLKQLNEDLGDLRRTQNTLTNERASKFTELRALGKKENLTDDEQSSYDQVKAEIDQIDSKMARNEEQVDMLKEQITNEKLHGDQQEDRFQFSDTGSDDSPEQKELQNFSFSDAIRQATSRGSYNGFVAEMHQEGVKEAKEAGVQLSNNSSVVIPSKVLRAMKLNARRFGIKNDVTAGTAGTKTIETESIDFVSLLRERLILRQLGATFAAGLVGNIPLTRQATGFEFGWAATENATAGESTSTYNNSTLSPKRGTGYMDVSNQWLMQSSPEIEQALVEDILNGTRVGIETAAVNGAGSNGEPEGILNTSGIGAAYAGGAENNSTNADGAAQAWDDWVNLTKEVAVENADFGNLGYLTNPKVQAQARLTKIDTGSGIFIWDKLMAENTNIGISNIVPSNLEKGVSGTTLSSLIYGNWRDLWIGQWGGLELMPNPYTKAKDAITEMIVHVYVDVAVRRPDSFAAVKDIDAQ